MTAAGRAVPALRTLRTLPQCEADPEQLKKTEAFLADCKKDLAAKGVR